jgi:uncharacterized membrane protein
MKLSWTGIRNAIAPRSPIGIALGGLAFLASLTPSLIPRTPAMQGIIAAFAFMLAYAIGAGLARLYRWLGFTSPEGKTRSTADAILTGIALVAVAIGLVFAESWQNATQQALGINAESSWRSLIVILVALPLILIILLIARFFGRIARLIGTWLDRFIPERAAKLAGFTFAIFLAWSIGNGLLVRNVVRVLDSSYSELDEFIPPDMPPPEEYQKTGSAESLIAWDGIGAAGRRHILSSPNQADIEELTAKPAMEPLRVYVGLNSAETPEERANLALEELLRIGAFDRSLLVIATPTGTGWIDPAAMAPVEMLQRGDIASVSVQYSYLPSWLSLFTQPEYGHNTARAVFDVVYGHWRSLPPDKRPKLFLFGLSLGTLNSEQSFDFHDIVGEPFDGALWVGPPFASPVWQDITRNRNQDSPAWLPVFRDSSLFRFRNQNGPFKPENDAWGPMRFAYLQYGSDPIVFLDTKSAWRSPAWLNKPRAPDVAPELRWIPVITFLKTAYDAMTATTTPAGTGHVYDAEHYLAAWQSLLETQDWSEEDMQKLRAWLKDREEE